MARNRNEGTFVKVTLVLRAQGREGYDTRQDFADQIARSVATIIANDAEWATVETSSAHPCRDPSK